VEHIRPRSTYTGCQHEEHGAAVVTLRFRQSSNGAVGPGQIVMAVLLTAAACCLPFWAGISPTPAPSREDKALSRQAPDCRKATGLHLGFGFSGFPAWGCEKLMYSIMCLQQVQLG